MNSSRFKLIVSRKLDIFRYFSKKVTKPEQSPNSNLKFSRDNTYGQPTCFTHPQLIAQGDVTTLITAAEYQNRRQKLIETIVNHSSKEFNSRPQLIIIPSASKQYMSDKIPYVFRQNTDFFYLTGCQEPDSCLVLTTASSGCDHKSTLFMRDKDSHSELWDGPRTGPDCSVEFFGVDQSLSILEMDNFLKYYLMPDKSATLWYDFINPIQEKVHKVIVNFLQNAMTRSWLSPSKYLHEVRKIKSPAEIALMQKSCDIACDAIAKCISTSKPGISEHQIFAKVDYECRTNGAEILAYPPVVAGGDRATTIHYINNNQIVNSGDMVLMDAGCEYRGYSSDITRTWPINGKFTPTQLELYEAVLSVQLELIEMCAAMTPLDTLFDSMCMLLGKRLQEVGLAPGGASYEQLFKTAYQFCPHHVSHYLGMDVHDTPSVARTIPLQPGMMITIEPGIYINHTHKVPKKYKGLGIRIEDDILITESGPIVLSRNCPKSPAEIEKLASASN